jgi:ubiquinone/menaquinone biosynthesis C-methylase UbiE/uncharacterized protein YbaR (Trm112 family)
VQASPDTQAPVRAGRSGSDFGRPLNRDARMISREVLDILTCPHCDGADLRLGGGRLGSLDCPDCGVKYPIDRGIVDLTEQSGSGPIRHYRTESLYDGIAGWFDVVFPTMSALIWNCSPFRYVDWGHRAVGRAQGGRLLVNPLGTGLLLRHVHSVHVDFPIVGVDISWKMLRRAQSRFARHGVENVTLVRAEPSRLPFAARAFRAVMSLNGINGFYDRDKALAELGRVTEEDGFITGTSLCRGLERRADRVLDRYERWGIYPILRSRDYLIRELEEVLGVTDVAYETHGAVVFFTIALERRARAQEKRRTARVPRPPRIG